MKRDFLLRTIGGAMILLAASVFGQDTPSGNNTEGPLSLESRTSSPAGQTDFQTDPFTGRFGYTVPLDLAPARHNSTPSLALIYNSANGNDWCGVGWNIDLGYIERETKYGVPVQWSGGKPVSPMAYDDTKGFLFSFKNKMSDLEPIGNNAWRAQVQSDFLQFQYNTSANDWTVTDKSGNVYYFGEASASRMTNPKSGWSSSGDANTFHWALDKIVTPTGDEATISYTSAGGRLYPQTYSYNGSTLNGGITAPCVVNFYLTTTNRPDTTVACRAAYVVTNQYLLSAITHTVSGQTVWSNKLNYSFSSSTGRALLSSITHYGTDLSTALPPVTFGYSQQNFTFQSPSNWGNLYSPNSADNAYYYSFNNGLCDLVDIDGDGLPDRVLGPDAAGLSPTTWWVQHNTGSGFANATTWTLGSQSLPGQYNTASDITWAQFNTHGRVIDMNGDGLPDLIWDPISMFASPSSYKTNVVQLNTGTGLATQFSWTNVNDQYSTTEQTTEYREVENSVYVAMLDMNGDGLPDRVMIPPAAPYNYYLVQFNTGSGFGGTNYFGSFYAQGGTNDQSWGGLNGSVGSTGNGVSMRMLDINGDGLPDRVMLVYSNGQGTLPTAYQTNLVVELNNGYGFEPARNWTNVNSYDNVACGAGYTTGNADLGDDAFVAYRDINGDGLPDRIIACQCTATPYTNWWVQLNTGTGFAPLRNWGPLVNQGQTANQYLSGMETTANGTGVAMLLDMNGDGLPDHVEVANNGPLTYYVVELSSGPFPDLLTIASNGLGGVVSATYKPSTQYDNRQNTNTTPGTYLLPFPYYTVSSVSVGDGIYPSNTTTYSYTGGYWNYVLRQFDGFAQTTVTDPLGMKTVHWFHQAGGRNNSSYGEYLDSTNTIGKVGMEYRTDLYGTNGSPYSTTLNQVDEYSNQLQHFAYIGQTIDVEYPGASNPYRATARQSFYNLSNGNLTNQIEWGQVTNFVVNGQTFTDIGNDTIYDNIVYASLNNNIVDKPSSITYSTDSAGDNILRQTNYTYDSNSGNLLQELAMICPGSYRSNTYTYDSYDNEHTATDPAGITTQTTYDSASETFPAQITQGGTFNTYTTYDPRSGSLFSMTDPAGWVVSNRYDVFLRLSEKSCSTTPNGSGSAEWLDQYTYTLGDSSGPQNSTLVQESDGVDLTYGHQTMTWFDGLGRTIQTRTEAETGQYRVVDTSYDKQGHVWFVSLPYFESGTSRSTPAGTLGTLHGYDPIGRPSQLTASETPSYSGGLFTGATATLGDGTSSPIGSSSVAYYYNNDPWTWVVADEASDVHRYSMDAYGHTNQVVEINQGSTYTTAFGLNLVGDLLSVTDNANNVIAYSNNLVGEVVGMADPDLGVWLYQRDYAGRIRQQTDGDGQTITYNYSPDPLGRLLSRQVYNIKGQFAYGVTNYYDTNTGDTTFPVYMGQLYKTIDNQGFTEYGYDVRGRKIITRRFLATNTNTYTNQYTYDDMDRVRSISYPNGGPVITNIYDTGANLSKIEPYGSGSYYYYAEQFTPLDQIETLYFANGSFNSGYTYYPNSARLEKVVTGGIQNLTYTYDQVSDIISITDGKYGGTAASAGFTGASYDSLHRLLGFSRDYNGETVSCTYDSIGDMLTYSENGSSSYTYSTTAPGATHLPHAVKNANGLNYAYDTSGNMLVRGGASLVYDPENRLIAVAASNQATTFGYDADGHRLWKQGALTNSLQVWINGVYEEKDGKILYHICAGDRPVYTYSSDNSITEYYIPDHLHSTEITTDSSGNALQHYEYGAYGNSRYVLSATAFPVTRRYTSQYFDEETGLYYFGARYYDPVLGRFVQPDTTIPNPYDPQLYDRYAYARDNPLRYVDPTGHAPSDGDDDDIPLTAGGVHAMLAHEDPQAAAIMQWGTGAAQATATVARAAAEANPIVGTFDNAYQAATGKDAINPNQSISTTERVLSGVQAVAAAAPVIAKSEEVASEASGILKNTARGREAEARVLKDMGLTKNSTPVSTAEGNSIPDAMTGKSSIEIKDTQVVNRTKQVRIQTDAAKAEGKESILVTGDNTKVSGPARKSFDKVETRPDLGPQQPPPSQ